MFNEFWRGEELRAKKVYSFNKFTYFYWRYCEFLHKRFNHQLKWLESMIFKAKKGWLWFCIICLMYASQGIRWMMQYGAYCWWFILVTSPFFLKNILPFLDIANTQYSTLPCAAVAYIYHWINFLIQAIKPITKLYNNQIFFVKCKFRFSFVLWIPKKYLKDQTITLNLWFYVCVWCTMCECVCVYVCVCVCMCIYLCACVCLLCCKFSVLIKPWEVYCALC